MLKSAAIRFAVSLCLTGLLLLPALVSARISDNSCPADEQAKHVCGGCDRCHVEAADELCGCCQGAKSQLATSTPALERSCCSTRHNKKSRRPTPLPTTPTCRCGFTAPPAAPSQLPRSEVELISTAKTLKSANNLAIIPQSDFAAVGDSPTGHLLNTPRDAQRRLCVWLI